MSTATSFADSSSSVSVSSSAVAAMNIVETWRSQRTSNASVPELLRARQTYGAASPGHGLLIGATTGRKGVTLPYLTSKAAWYVQEQEIPSVYCDFRPRN